jgi:hypothetical protein
MQENGEKVKWIKFLAMFKRMVDEFSYKTKKFLLFL